jgi:hypothetical protein
LVAVAASGAFNSFGAVSFPENTLPVAIFGNFQRAPEPVEATGVCYRGTIGEDKMQPSIRFPHASSGAI